MVVVPWVGGGGVQARRVAVPVVCDLVVVYDVLFGQKLAKTVETGVGKWLGFLQSREGPW
jgi:hypothetical protein